jgi:hypothetical protein
MNGFGKFALTFNDGGVTIECECVKAVYGINKMWVAMLQQKSYTPTQLGLAFRLPKSLLRTIRESITGV